MQSLTRCLKPQRVFSNSLATSLFHKTFHTTSISKMRLPYVDNPPKTESEEDAAIVKRVQARRHPRPLIPLDLALLHSPPVADGWNSFLGSVRTRSSLPTDIREIAICRVAVLNGANYEWSHHAPLAVGGGVSPAGMKILARADPYRHAEGRGKEEAEALSEKQWAVVRYTDASTRDVKVPENIFKELKGHFSDREVVEVTATVGAYNCVSRFLVALDVGEMNDMAIEDIDISGHH